MKENIQIKTTQNWYDNLDSLALRAAETNQSSFGSCFRAADNYSGHFD
jgi:hypothetical protein